MMHDDNETETTLAVQDYDDCDEPTQLFRKAFVGKYCIVRSLNDGINSGYVDAFNQYGVLLRQARRCWYHLPSDKLLAWYEGCAIVGLAPESKLSAPVDCKLIMENYVLTRCTEMAKKSFICHPVFSGNDR